MTKENSLKNFVSKPVDITGFSTINHNLRIKMQITCSEYVMMDYIYTSQIKKRIPEMTECYRKTGFTDKEQNILVHALVQKGLVLMPKSDQQTGFEITDKWNQHFHTLDQEFENEFWVDLDEEKGKIVNAWPGSKTQALKNYKLVRKNHTLEFLLKQRHHYFKYLKACHDTGFMRQKLMCSVFLGPQERFLENWEEETNKLIKPKQEAKPKKQAVTMQEIDKLYEENPNK